ncbi:ATP-binding protein [Dyadobacter sandarakinus]|uniref:histidine kinase n=1 Tax=Dyadobacter sandarakinus TaxID=2747268 RepID=A0ABX7I2A8_9BACT|nr:ATP-binding protein [Dyadobacter sandarakinus]QRQ99847.1 PAS domain-containing protein [Dyadobacter sandarakinus]
MNSFSKTVSEEDRMEGMTAALTAAGIGIWELNPDSKEFHLSPIAQQLLGATEDIIPYPHIFDFADSRDRARLLKCFREVMEGIPGKEVEIDFRHCVASEGTPRWLHCRGQAVFDPAKPSPKLHGILQDVSKHLNRFQEHEKKGSFNISAEEASHLSAKEQLARAKGLEQRLQYLIEEAPVATAMYMGRSLKIEFANDVMISYWGKDRTVIGETLRDAVPELDEQSSLDLLDQVFVTGKTIELQAAPVVLHQNGRSGTYYFDFIYKPMFDHEGNVFGIFHMAVDVTHEVQALKASRASEANLAAVLAAFPTAIGLLRGRDLIIEMPNQAFIEIVGKGPDIAGKPLRQIVQDPGRQHLVDVLDDIFITGKINRSYANPVTLHKDDGEHHRYFDFTNTPLHDADGRISAVLAIGIDVTEQVLARQKIEEAESTLRGAVDLAELGTWQLDLETQKLSFSRRLGQWFDFEPGFTATFADIYEKVQEPDRTKLRQVVEECLTANSERVFKVEFTLDQDKTGLRKTLTAQGRTYFDNDRHAYKLGGTMQDVTEHRALLSTLERLVQQRTEELAATNEKLVNINQELEDNVAQIEGINEELVQTNKRLVNSNNSLQQFSYVASHDLQEPLRKIQTFGTLLAGKIGTDIGQEAASYLSRMQQAASRMSALIEDLLSFSRVSNQEIKRDLVSLKTVMKWVLSDLELSIEETGATIEIGKLPIITGDQSQLMQLFNNLISNALKFHKPGIPPVIRIDARILTALPPKVVARRSVARYHQIDVVDNGIGFDPMYKDRIFQVFQRLHGKSEFPGTGIGLAICEKVAFNHGGAITATSEPDAGSVFSIYLPIE